MSRSISNTAVARRSRVLITSLGVSLAAVTTLAMLLVFAGPVEASTCALSSTAPTTLWSDTTKWTGCAGTYPNAGDTAQIGLPGSYTLKVDVPVNVILQIQTTPVAMDVSSTLKLEASSTAVSGSNITINSGGNMQVATSANLGGGFQSNITINSGGTFELQSGSSMTIGSGSAFNFNGGTIKGPGTLNIPLSTPIALTGSSGSMTMTGALIFNNNGIVNLVSSTNPLAIDSGTQFNNQSGATFNINTSIPITTDGLSAPAINNFGSIAASSGNNPTINPPLNNKSTGNITLSTGVAQTLKLAGGGTHTGAFNTVGPSIGTIAFDGTHTFNSGFSFNTGPSSVFEVLGGTANINANLVTPFFKQDAGTVNSAATISISSDFSWAGGTQTGGGTTSLIGVGSITATSPVTLTGNHILDIQNGAIFTYNPGAGGSLAMTGSGVIALNGTLDLKSDATITSDGSNSINIGSTGILKKSAGTRTEVDAFVNQSPGTIQTASNTTIALGGSATIAGPVNTSAPNSFLEFAANTAAIVSGASVTSGDFLLTGGTLQVNTPLTINTMTMSGTSLLKGTQPLTVGNFNWTGGTMDGDTGGTGTLAISTPNGIAFINGGATTITRRFTFSNGGTVHYQPSSPLAVNAGGQIANSGTWQLENNTAITSDTASYLATAPSFANTSLLTKTVGGATLFGVPLNSSSTVTLNNGSELDITGGGTINGGTINLTTASDLFRVSTNQLSIVSTPPTAVNGSGWIIVNNTGTLTNNNPSLTVPNFEIDNGGFFNGTGGMTVTGGYKTTGGNLSGGGTTNYTGAAGDFTSLAGNFTLNLHTFNNSGTINYNPTFPIAFTGAGHFNNQATGTLNITGPGGTQTSGVANTFGNAGIINRTGGSTFFTFDLPFTNSGTVDAQSPNTFVAFTAGGSMTAGNMQGSVASAGVEFGGGTFNVSGGGWGTAGGLKISGGTLNINTPMIAPANVALISGVLGTTAAGTLSMNAGSIAALKGGTVSGIQLIANTSGAINFDTTSGNVTVSGATLGWNTGSTGSWVGGNQIVMSNGATMSVGGSLNWGGNGTVANGGGAAPSILVNGGGSLQKTTSVGPIDVAVELENNGGTISSISGGLRLMFTGTVNHTGTFDAGSAASIEFGGTGGTNIFNATTSGTGAGVLHFVGGTSTFSGSTSLTNLQFDAGTLNGTGPITFSGTFDWDGGNLNVPASGGTLNLSGGVGVMNLGANLTNGANFSSATNAFNIGTGVTYTNNGTFTATGGAPITGSGTFVNSGTINRTLTNQTNVISAPFNNNGTVVGNNGELDIASSGTDTGSYAISAVCIVAFSGGVRTLTAASSVPAGMSGLLRFNGANVTVNGTFTPSGAVTMQAPSTLALNTVGTASIGVFNLNSGTLTGTSALQLAASGSHFLSGGTITGSGSFTNLGTTTIGAATVTLDGRTLTNGSGGTLDFILTGALDMTNGAALVNQSGATIDIGNDNLITNTVGAATISNAGNFTKSGGGATGSVAPAFTNTGNVTTQSGTLDFANFTQSSGTTTLNGGQLQSAATMNFTGGTLTGDGNILGSVTNSGATIDPAGPTTTTPGLITVSGNFNQTAGTLHIDLINNGTADQLFVNSPGTLGSNLQLAYVAPYVPANGDSFNAFHANTVTDSSTMTWPPYGPGNIGQFTKAIQSGTDLIVTAVLPQDDRGITVTGPTNVIHNGNWNITIPIHSYGPSGSTGVSVNLSATGGTFNSVSGPGFVCGTGPGPITCTITTLGNGSTATLTASLNATSLSGISITGTITGNEADPNATNDSVTYSASVTPSADLSLAITDSPDPVNAGATVNYTAAVSNAGPDAATATVSLTKSGGTFGALPAGCSTTPSVNTITCTTSLANGGSANFVVPVTAPGSGPLTLSGSVAASAAVDTNSANDTASQSTAINPSADLQITKSGPSSVFAGQNVVYTIAVKNNGPSNATGVSVADLTPSGLTFVSNAGACTTTFPCSLGGVASGSTVIITSTYSTSPASAPTNVNNSATVSSTSPDGNNANNTSTATTSVIPNADIAVQVTGPSTAFPGSSVTLTIKVLNAGPSNANAVSVAASVSPSLTFSGNSGACTTPYPCSIGSLNAGQFVLITSTYNVNAGGTTANATYTGSAATPDGNTSNDSDTQTITTGCPNGAPVSLQPGNSTGVATAGTLSWDDTGATKYNIYLGPAGGGCNTLYGSVTMGSARITQLNYSGLDAGRQYEWAVEAVTPGCQTFKSSCVTFTTATNCTSTAPQPASPVNTVVPSPVTFTWTASPGATLYTVKNAADDSTIGTSATTSLANILVPDGQLTWYVVTDVPGCGLLRSVNATFNTCNVPPAPVVGAVAQAQSGQTYAVQFDRIPGMLSYDLEEATNGGFTDVKVFTIPQPADGPVSMSFTKSSEQGASPFFYRARARSACGQAFGPYSTVIRVVVLPPQPKTEKNPNVTVPAGSTSIVVQQVFVPGLDDGIVHTYSATVDKPWLTVEPATGILPAEGVTLFVKANPATLPNGTETGTVVVTIFTAANKTGSEGSTQVTVPVSVNLVTPIIPSTKDLPPDNTLIIPSVGHLDGLNSHWQSDIRLANTGGSKVQYALKFTPGDPSAGGVKTTTINVDGGATTALDDIVRNWYGVGTLGESANGVLEVRPLTPSSKGAPGTDADTPSVSKVTVVSSRTYNVSSNGTLGQFIPAIPFGSFINKAAQSGTAAVLSLQQIAQSAQFRTNVGIVEGSGQPANVLVSIFDVNGKKLKDVPIQLRGGEQLQMNGFLANVGIPTLQDGRIEVKVTSGEGRVTAYASVVDNQSLDPLLVTGVKLGAASSNKYVLPGVADLNTGLANWRTDMRLFNGGTAAQNATLTFFRQGQSPLTQTIVINAGEIRSMDSIVNTLFGVTNAGGAVHVSTPGNSNLVVSARTYNATSNGTFGQFIPAVTPADAVAAGDRPLQILQVEDSVRYRTNIGLAEVTGKPAGVDVEIHLPDSKVTPVVHMDLAPNDFQQFNPFRALGVENIYNARIAIRVTSGEGKVTAYGSVVDMLTNDPAYVPGQSQQ